MSADTPVSDRERVIFANARRIASRHFARQPNWALAADIFGLGSNYARALCQRIGVDPDGRTMKPVATTGGDA